MSAYIISLTPTNSLWPVTIADAGRHPTPAMDARAG